MSNKLSLEKNKNTVRLILEKRRVPPSLTLQVKAIFDVSGSIEHYFRDGTIGTLVGRLIPVGLRFDDNGSIESYAFASNATKLSDITEVNYETYADLIEVEAKKAGVLWGGTSYSRALTLMKKELAPPGGIMGLFKKAAPKIPSYLKFITDGDTNGDEYETEKLLEELKDSNVYVQLIGVGRGSRFDFLKRMADKFDHVGFVTFPDLARVSDEEMYEALLSVELCTWMTTR